MVQLQDCKHGESYATVPHFTTVSNPLTLRLVISYDKIFTQLLNLWTKSLCYHSIENSLAELLRSAIHFYRFYNKKF